MRVFNLTDVPTPALAACGLVNASIMVGGCSIPPGGNDNVERLGADDRRFILCGAISIGEPPPAYRAAKAVRPTPTTPEPLVEIEVKVGEETEEQEAEVPETEASEPVTERKSKRGFRGRKKG